MITIDDVAKKAGVSKSSVSRVLNGNFKYMSDETKTKIMDAIQELNYTPNALAQSLKKKKTRVIGIILSDISNPFWSEVLNGVQQECMRNGYGLMVSSSGENPEMENQNILILRNKQVDGLIINTAGYNSELFHFLMKEGLPLAFLDRVPGHVKADTIVVDNLLGAKQAIDFLIQQGHRRISIFSYPLINSPRIDRLEGYKQALLSHGLPVDESLIQICQPERGQAIHSVVELLSLPNRPTALFSTHTFLNLEVLAGIKKKGLLVPRDVSVIGYDDFPWVPFLDPPLSTVAQPAFEMGVKAAALLIHKIEKKKLRKSKQSEVIQLKPELIVRNSCAYPQIC